MFKFLSRAWFPLTLVLLFLAALPGVALVVLAAMEQDAIVNTWLQENFQITYHLALSHWLVLLLVFIPLAIILLYFLKLKRKPIQVPSTFLWKKSIEDLHVNALLQWLRENLLLLLQILIILFLIYSTLGLRFHGSTSEARHYIVLIDNSASMAATDVEPSRLHWAKQEALKVVEAAGDRDHGMVIVFNSKATTVQGYTDNRAKLRDAIRGIEQTSRPTRLEEALTLIDGLANPVRSTEDASVRPPEEKPGEERAFVQPLGISTTVHFFSDGRYARIADSTLASLNSRQIGNTSILGNIKLYYHPAGKNEPGNANNIGIVGFKAFRTTRPPTDKKPSMKEGGAIDDLHRFEASVRVQNFRKQAARVTLRLDVVVDGKLAHTDQQVLDLEPRVYKASRAEAGKAEAEEERESDTPGTAADPRGGSFVLPSFDVDSNVVLHAYLDKAGDHFPLDDEAWFVVGRIRKGKVVLVTPGNSVLDAFFDQEATRKFASCQRLTPADLETDAYRSLARSGLVDLVIFDRCAPKEDPETPYANMPQANTFFIDQLPPPWLRGKKVLKNPYLVVSKTSSPLLRHITSLWDIGVAEGFVFDIDKDLDETAKMRYPTLPSLTALLEAGGKVPVVFTLPRGAYTDLVMTFPLVVNRGDLNTNWPLQPSFPLFILNILHSLGNVDDAVRAVTVQPGEPMVLRPEAGVRELTITPPKGQPTQLKRGARADFTYADTEHLGIYRMVYGDKAETRFLAVNLLETSESTLDPREQIRIGSEDAEAGRKEIFQPRELWKWILVLALFLLVAEWFFYNRRVSI